MKTVFLFSICLLLARLAAAADLNFSLTALGAGTTTNRVIVVRPEWQNPTNTIGLADATLLRTGTNSSVTLSNVPESILAVEIMAPPARTVFSIYVPDTNGTLNVADMRGLGTGGKLDPNKYSWSVRASDARYAQIGSTNVNPLVTSDSATVTFSGDGTAGSPLSASASVTNLDNAGGTNLDVTGVFRATGKDYFVNVPIIGNNFDGYPVLRYPNNVTFAYLTVPGSGPGGAACLLQYPDGAKMFDSSDGYFRVELGIKDGMGRPIITYNWDNDTYEFSGAGGGIFLTNAAGSRFTLIVNSATNGFDFLPVP
jgi:hypothetical protein